MGEECLQRLGRLLGQIHLAVVQALYQFTRRQIDQADVAQTVENRIGDGLADPDAGDLVHHVVQAFQVLDIDRGVDVDASIEQFFHVLPASLVTASGGVAMGQLIDRAMPVPIHPGPFSSCLPGLTAWGSSGSPRPWSSLRPWSTMPITTSTDGILARQHGLC